TKHWNCNLERQGRLRRRWWSSLIWILAYAAIQESPIPTSLEVGRFPADSLQGRDGLPERKRWYTGGTRRHASCCRRRPFVTPLTSRGLEVAAGFEPAK